MTMPGHGPGDGPKINGVPGVGGWLVLLQKEKCLVESWLDLPPTYLLTLITRQPAPSGAFFP
jgi:hypothetical protein